MAKWIAAENVTAGLRHSVVCPNVTVRTKDGIAQSKGARACSLAIVDQPQVARICIFRAFGLQNVSFSGVTFFFRFRFRP